VRRHEAIGMRKTDSEKFASTIWAQIAPKGA